MSASGAAFRGVAKRAGRCDPTLVLRQWCEADRAPFASMNADPEVMEHFPGLMSREESDALVARLRASIESDGYGLWAAEIPGEAPFIGFVGVQYVSEAMPFAPALEVGWRLARPYWGRSLAFEGAQLAVEYAFEQLGVEEVVAYTAERNDRSRRLMERLGMTRDTAGDFMHPAIALGSPVRAHVLYRLARAAWAGA